MLAHLLPINEGYGSRTNIERLAKDLSGLAHRLSSNPYGQGVDSMDYPYLSSYLSVVCGRDVGPAALDLLHPFTAQESSRSGYAELRF